ncbi:hypothetical protein CDL12_18437 [Handroanthus impetiginosus]|uniref:RING-type E3 ubiquitin transferase n=1 Tax=Handroanthus impetiginosus TaxID=429701 RepID=A0A2G9GUL6_9LAMI|nr:hypothetical protein CDL12_18437 [Handroanthus impetiginosus]
MDTDSRLPPGVYDYSVMAGPNRNNHNPPTLRSLNDLYAVTQVLNQYPLQDHDSFGDAELFHDLLMNDEAMDFSEFDFLIEGQSIMVRSEEEEWRLWNFLDQGGSWADFPSINRPSEDIITERLKTRSVVEDDREDKICVVCQDCFFHEEDKIATLDCGHEYHVGCIKNWLTRKNRCPLCNAAGVSVD